MHDRGKRICGKEGVRAPWRSISLIENSGNVGARGRTPRGCAVGKAPRRAPVPDRVGAASYKLAAPFRERRGAVRGGFEGVEFFHPFLGPL